MTTSVRFYLSYDPLKWDIIAFKMNSSSVIKCIIVNDVTLRKVLLHVWSYDFYNSTLYPLDNSDVMMTVNSFGETRSCICTI